MAWRHRNQQHSSSIYSSGFVQELTGQGKQGLWSSPSCHSGWGGGGVLRQSVCLPHDFKLVLVKIFNDDRWPFPPFLILKISAHDLNSREFLVSSRCNLRELGGALCAFLSRHQKMISPSIQDPEGSLLFRFLHEVQLCILHFGKCRELTENYPNSLMYVLKLGTWYALPIRYATLLCICHNSILFSVY